MSLKILLNAKWKGACSPKVMELLHGVSLGAVLLSGAEAKDGDREIRLYRLGSGGEK